MNAPEKSSVAVCSACGAALEGDATACFHCGHTRRSPPLKKGQVISNRYELTGVLGRGGMGTVYEAQDRSLDERVALKVLSETAYGSADADRRFRAEIKLARKIRHPNVCAIHEYGELEDMQYIVMEFVDGQDLKKYLRSQPDLPTAEAINLARQIGEGLQAIHDAGVIHRDLKLANVMRDSTGRLRLMDFGIAKGIADSTATATGHIVGTPEYMSPEQARGERVDSRSDVYALGIVTFELLTGRVPFKADTPLATLMLHAHEPPQLDDPRIPSSLVPALRKALAKKTDERYASVRDFVAALTSAPLPTPTPPQIRTSTAGSKPELTTTIVAQVPPPRSRARLAGLALGALLAVTLLGWLGMRQESEQDTGEALPATQPTASIPVTQTAGPQPLSVAPPGKPAPSVETSRSAEDPRRTGGGKTAASKQMPSPSVGPKPSPARLSVPSETAQPRSQSPTEPSSRLEPTVEARKTSQAAEPPANNSATLTIVAPEARIFLEEVEIGASAATVGVSPGLHRLRFEHALYRPLRRRVVVASGEKVSIAIDWKLDGVLK